MVASEPQLQRATAGATAGSLPLDLNSTFSQAALQLPRQTSIRLLAMSSHLMEHMCVQMHELVCMHVCMLAGWKRTPHMPLCNPLPYVFSSSLYLLACMYMCHIQASCPRVHKRD